MRKFYQIYQDGFYWNNFIDDTVKILSTIQNELKATINTLDKDNHQYIIRFSTPQDVRELDEIKVGYNFLQVSSTKIETATKIYELVEKFITVPFENNQNTPF